MRSTILVLVAVSLVPAARAQTAPWNDRCADAFLFAQGHAGSFTNGATPDGISSCASAANSPDVWYLVIPQSSGVATVEACRNPSGAMDPVLSVHTACPGDVTNEIACSDDAPPAGNCLPGTARVQFAATAGQPYWVRLAGANGASGASYLSVTGVALPPAMNDVPETAIDVEPGDHIGLMGIVPTPPTCFASYGSFYHYTPSASGPVTASTCGPHWIDASLSVSDGSTLIGCCDDCCVNYQAYVTWNAIAGREYTIRVSDFWAPIESAFRLTVEGPPRAAAACATAAVHPYGSRLIDLGRGAASGSSSCDAVPDTAWYGRVVASCDGVLTVSTCGTNDFMAVGTGPDTILSLHSNCPADASTQLACSNDAPSCGGQLGAQRDARITWPVSAGDSYIVRLTRDPQSSRTLPILLTVECEPLHVFCRGDGSATPCPCGNSGLTHRGCENSAGTGGSYLSRSGLASMVVDTLTLHAYGTTPSATGLYFQGTDWLAGGNGIPFGDGLRCVSGNVVRLGFRVSSGGSSSFGATDGTGTSVSVAGGLPAAGGTRYYQLWYRDALTFCSASTFNLSNGLRILWNP